MPLHVSSTVVLINRRSKFYYKASGIVTPVGGRPVHRTATYRVWRYQMLYNTVLTSWWWAQQCSKHIEAYKKLIKNKILCINLGNYKDRWYHCWSNDAMLVLAALLQLNITFCKVNRLLIVTVKHNNSLLLITLFINALTPNDLYMSRTAPLTSKRCILYIYSTNVGTEYFKYALYSPFFSLQNAVCFIMLTCLVTVLFTFYIQGVLKLKK